LQKVLDFTPYAGGKGFRGEALKEWWHGCGWVGDGRHPVEIFGGSGATASREGRGNKTTRAMKGRVALLDHGLLCIILLLIIQWRTFFTQRCKCNCSLFFNRYDLLPVKAF
jgi:hypothetical protein